MITGSRHTEASRTTAPTSPEDRPLTAPAWHPRAEPRPDHRGHGVSLGSALRIAVEGLGRSRTRSVLSTLGIIIGVASVVATMALGEGTRQQVEAQIRRMGTNLLSVRPGERRQGAVRLGMESRDTLTLADAAAVAEKCPAVVRTSPRVRGSAQVEYRNRNTRTEVMGVTGDYFPIRNWAIAAGRPFRPPEIGGRARVCVLGSAVAQQLFGSRSPLGKRVSVKGQPFRVIGVLAPRGGSDADWDDRVCVPVTTAMDRLFGLDQIERIEVQAAHEASLRAAEEQIEALLRRRHRIRPAGESDFEIRNQQDWLDTADATGRILTYTLASMAAISLLVGGIGIMNILLVSVTERTREIGIRRAVGARRADILAQFLIEALMMCALGAVVGLASGIAACWVGTAYLGWPTAVTLPSVLLACSAAVVVGMIFGLYPALRAAGLLPIVALRHD